MRLIDADALIKALIRKEPFSDCARVVIAECMAEVRHAPTIEERKKGKWLLHTYMPHNKYCSCCEKDSPYGKWWNFCPICGAKMEETE